MRYFIPLAAIALVAAPSSALVNGSFEDGVDPGPTFTTLPAGSTDLTGWTINQGSIDYIGGYWEASDGERSIDLSGTERGQISQRLTDLTAGYRYLVTFDMSGNPDGGVRDVRLIASVTGGEAQLYTYSVTEANSLDNMLYQTFTYEFIASGTPQDIQFLSLERNPFGPALDNITLSVIPEPATWGLMIAGFGLVGFAARRRARPIAA